MRRSHLFLLVLAAPWLANPPERAEAALTVDPNAGGFCRISGGSGFTDYPASAAVESTPEEKTVSFDFEKAVSFGPILGYLGTLDFDCFLFGSASARYGSLVGKIESTTDARPETLAPEPGSGNDPRPNDGYTRAEGFLQLAFDDAGIVTGPGPDGTPVTLEFSFALDAVGLVTGRPPGPDAAVASAFTVDVLDLSAFSPVTGYPTLHRVVYPDPGLVTATFDTAVGHELEVKGELGLRTVAQSGATVGPFYTDVDASIDASHTAELRLDGPAGIGLAADSGHDYTSVPEPNQASLLVSGALLLAACRAPRRRA